MKTHAGVVEIDFLIAVFFLAISTQVVLRGILDHHQTVRTLEKQCSFSRSQNCHLECSPHHTLSLLELCQGTDSTISIIRLRVRDDN